MRDVLRIHPCLRAVMALLLALALLMRIAAPVGFVPITADDTISIRICDGSGHDARIALNKGAPVEKHDAADKPCAFGFGMAVDLPAPPAIGPPAPH